MRILKEVHGERQRNREVEERKKHESNREGEIDNARGRQYNRRCLAVSETREDFLHSPRRKEREAECWRQIFQNLA